MEGVDGSELAIDEPTIGEPAHPCTNDGVFIFIDSSGTARVTFDGVSYAFGEKILSDGCTVSGSGHEYKGSFSKLKELRPGFHREVSRVLAFLGYVFNR